MVISRTPFRISFFGGGTDYPAWFRDHGGSVLATTINKYCYISVRHLPPFFEHKFRIVYRKIESCQNIDEIEHPSVREILRYLKVDRGLEIHHDGDLPARSGIGSSSAFTVGLLNALHALQGYMPSKQQLSKESIYIEQEVLKETVGSQDQVLAAYGGFNHVTFFPNGEISVKPITLSAGRVTELQDCLLLFYTGVPRKSTASEIAKGYINNIAAQKQQLRVIQILVEEAIEILRNGQDLKLFGEALNETWQLKRSWSSTVSNPFIDDIYDNALESGAIGGKLIGAGGGGFLLLFVPPKAQTAVLHKLRRLLHVPFKFESLGSQVIHFDQEEDYAVEIERQLRNIQSMKTNGGVGVAYPNQTVRKSRDNR